MKKIKVLSTAALLLAAATLQAAAAETHEVAQAGKKFTERRLTIAVGDTIKFINDDSSTHNVHSNSDDHEFDLGAQAPGTTSAHTFSTPGKAKVRCAIHPKMKIDVTIVE